MPRRASHPGFAFFDLIVAITLAAALAALVVPMLRDTSYVRLAAAAEILASDIELAQTMSIANPADPVVVRLDPAADRYWLARASSPDDPIAREDLEGNPGAGPLYEVRFGAGRARHTGLVQLDCSPGDTLTFNELGGLRANAAPTITLSYGTRWRQLTITPSTGSIAQTSGGT